MPLIRPGQVDNPEGDLWAFAYPNPNIAGTCTQAWINSYLTKIPPKYYVLRFDERDGADLVQDLKDAQNKASWTQKSTGKKLTGATLKELEVCSHGAPRYLTPLNLQFAADEFKRFGNGLATLVWADDCAIYLSGCNTGCRANADEQGIAERLAELIPAKPKAFRCTVYGAVGELWYNHASGDAYTTPTVYPWSRQGRCTENDPDPHMRPWRGYRGANSA